MVTILWVAALLVTLAVFNVLALALADWMGVRWPGEDEFRGFSLEDPDTVLILLNLVVVCGFVAALLAWTAWRNRGR